jgi:hypothetical protein
MIHKQLKLNRSIPTPLVPEFAGLNMWIKVQLSVLFSILLIELLQYSSLRTLVYHDRSPGR